MFEKENQADYNRFQPRTSGLSKHPEEHPDRGTASSLGLDITDIQFLHENIDLAIILNLFSRTCIGWELSRNLGNQPAMNVLSKELKNL
jgi:hypothetical protein